MSCCRGAREREREWRGREGRAVMLGMMLLRSPFSLFLLLLLLLQTPHVEFGAVLCSQLMSMRRKRTRFFFLGLFFFSSRRESKRKEVEGVRILFFFF